MFVGEIKGIYRVNGLSFIRFPWKGEGHYQLAVCAYEITWYCYDHFLDTSVGSLHLNWGEEHPPSESFLLLPSVIETHHSAQFAFRRKSQLFRPSTKNP